MLYNNLLIWLGVLVFLYVTMYKSGYPAIKWLGAILMSVIGYNVVYIPNTSIMDSQISLIVVIISVMFAVKESMEMLTIMVGNPV